MLDLGEVPSFEGQSPKLAHIVSGRSSVPAPLADWLEAHALGQSKDLDLLTMAVGVFLSLMTHKTELIVVSV